MTDTEHSPLPWTPVISSDRFIHFTDANGMEIRSFFISLIRYAGNEVGEDGWKREKYVPVARARGDAELIRRAVNSYGAMREALKTARSFVELTYDKESGEEAADAKAALDEIDAALALAAGDAPSDEESAGMGGMK